MFLAGQPSFKVGLPVSRLSLSSPWMWDADELVNSLSSRRTYTQRFQSEEGYYTHASFHKLLNLVSLTSPSNNSVVLLNIDKKDTEVIGFPLTCGVSVQQSVVCKNSVVVMGDTDILLYRDVLANEKLITDKYVEAGTSRVQTGKHHKLICDMHISTASRKTPLKVMSISREAGDTSDNMVSVAFGNSIHTYDMETGTLRNRSIHPYTTITTLKWTSQGLYTGTDNGQVLFYDFRSPNNRYLSSSDTITPVWDVKYNSDISALEGGSYLPYLLGIGTLSGDLSVLDMRYATKQHTIPTLVEINGLGPISGLTFAEHHIQYMSASVCGDVVFIDLSEPSQPVYTLRGEIGPDGIGVPKALGTSMLHSPLTITTAFSDGSAHVHKVPDTVASALSKRVTGRLFSTPLRADRSFGGGEEKNDESTIDDMLSMYHTGRYGEALDTILQKALRHCLSGELGRSEQLLVLVDMLDSVEGKEEEEEEGGMNAIEGEDEEEEKEERGHVGNKLAHNTEPLGRWETSVIQKAKADFRRIVRRYGTFDLSPYKVPEDALLIRNTIRTLNNGLSFLHNQSTDDINHQEQLHVLVSPESIIKSGMVSLGLYFYKPTLTQGIELPGSPKSSGEMPRRPYERLFSSLLMVVLHVLLISVGDALSAMKKLRSLLQTWTGGFEMVLSPLPIILETLLMPSIFSQDSGFSLSQMVSILSSILDSQGRSRGDAGAALGGEIAYFVDVINELETVAANEAASGGDKTALGSSAGQAAATKTRGIARWKSATADESSESYDSSSKSDAPIEDNVSDPITQDISTPPSTVDRQEGSGSNSLDMNFAIEHEETSETLSVSQPTAQYGTLSWCVRELFKEAGKAIMTPFRGKNPQSRQMPTVVYSALEDEAEKIVALRLRVDEEMGRGDVGFQQTLTQTQTQSQGQSQSQGVQLQQTLPLTSTLLPSSNTPDERGTMRRVAKAKMPMPGAGDSELYRVFWILSKLGTEMNLPPETQPSTAALVGQLQVMMSVAEGKSSISAQAPILISAPLFLSAIGELLAAKDFSGLRKTLDIHFRIVLEARGLRYKYIDVEKAGPMTAPFEQAVLMVCKTLVWPMLIQRLLMRAKGCAEACAGLELLLKYLGSIPTLLVLKDLPFIAHFPSLIRALATQFVLFFKQAKQGIGFGDVENVATLIRKVTQIHLVEEAKLIEALVGARDVVENLLNLKQKR